MDSIAHHESSPERGSVHLRVRQMEFSLRGSPRPSSRASDTAPGAETEEDIEVNLLNPSWACADR